ncbi:MAG: glycosyl transferase family 2 [Bacteroidia bacterium]|nr:MAG: glycosyl transferase family 2 [Bacteroidia bacterium]
MPSVAICILNYNGLSLLQHYLPIVTQHHQPKDIYIIDNCSTDECVSWIQKHYPEIHIIQNTENLGFAKGYNEGLKHIQADYYVLMNNDIRTTPNWLEPIIQWMELHPEVAVTMPKLLDDKTPEKFEYAGACGGFIDILGYPFCRGRIFLSLEKDENQYDNIQEIFWATGACMVIKSKIFWEVGGFDDDFFAHMEEIDLCWRIKNIGYKIFVLPFSSVYHLGGGTLNKTNPQKTYLNFRNSLLTLIKNHPQKYLFFKVFLRLILDGIAGIKFLLEGHGKHTIAVIQAHLYFYKNFSKFWKKRKEFEQKHSFKYTFNPVFKKSIVIQHYLLGKKKFSELQI